MTTSTNAKEKRLYDTLRGHYFDLCAVFARSAAHKLPGAKGKLREDAVSRFLRTFIPKRFDVPTNVLATSLSGIELDTELDLVIHDSYNGAIWPLDAEEENCVAIWENIRLVAQIKSTLTEEQFVKACDVMQKITEFGMQSGEDPPIRVLFAYKVDEEFMPHLYEKFVYNSSGTFPFDAFFLLEEGAYFSDHLRELRIGIRKGLTPSEAINDGPSVDRMILEDCIESRIPEGYRSASDGTPESTLFAFVCLATYAASGEDAIKALLSATRHREYFPISDATGGN